MGSQGGPLSVAHHLLLLLLLLGEGTHAAAAAAAAAAGVLQKRDIDAGHAPRDRPRDDPPLHNE